MMRLYIWIVLGHFNSTANPRLVLIGVDIANRSTIWLDNILDTVTSLHAKTG
jgi:hypothetical protein